MALKKHAHHGGSWKVAYADFVTAMMALFLVLWLTSQDQAVKDAVAKSFRHKFSAMTAGSMGLMPTKKALATRQNGGNFDSPAAMELDVLRRIAQDIIRTIQSNPDDKMTDAPMKVDIVPDGLRLSLFDRNQKPLFEPDSSNLTPYGDFVFSTLAWHLGRFTNDFGVELEGHTEGGNTPRKDGVDNWDLSTLRANEARRKLVRHDVPPEQIRMVAGFGDTEPLPGMRKEDERNRRVTVLLRMRNEKQK